MTLKYLTGIFLLIVICQFSCYSPKKHVKFFNNISVKETINLQRNLLNRKTDVYFGIQNVSNEDGSFFVSFAANKFRFENLFDSSKSFTLNCSEIFLGFSEFLVAKIDKTNLYILDGEKKVVIFYKLNYKTQKAVLEKYYIIPDKLELDFSKSRSIRFTVKDPFVINDSNLFICYSINNAVENNFLDDNAYLLVNMYDSLLNEFIPDLPIPDRYKKYNNYSANTFLKVINDSLLLYGFGAYDSLYIYNKKSNALTKRIDFSNNSNYRDFIRKKSKDLGYVRRFELTDELNENIIINEKARRILIIKRLRKENINDSSTYVYYLLNNSLEVLAFNKFEKAILPNYSMPYKDGFFIADESKKIGYYYE